MSKPTIIKQFFICCLAGILLFRANVQAQVLTDVSNSFTTYNARIFQEKLFVHTDKSFYLTGEVLWFKIYNVDAGSNKPAGLSKVAYVDVLDANNTPVLQAKIALEQGFGSGSVYLPVTLSNGNYRLRAYTSWMKNFDAGRFYQQTLTIVNPLKTPDDDSPKAASSNVDLQFFPEGGALLAGVNTRVAFKAVMPDGKGVDLSGAIINQKNDTVARVGTLRFGMGQFSFTPVAGDSYKAILRAINNSNVIAVKALPAIEKEGYGLRLTDDGNGKVRIDLKTLNRLDNALYLLVHSGSKVTLAQQATVSENTARFEVEKSRLGDGISHLTIFNTDKQPVCERLYFKRPQPLALVVATQTNYGSRSKVDLAISAVGADNRPRATDLSLAVYRVDSLNTGASPSNIFNYLWLASELRGRIESPDFYFNSVNEGTDEALDNLMLAQGWSRYNWKDVLNQPKLLKFKYLPEIEGHIITGQITNTASNKPANGVVAYLGATGKNIQMYAAEANQGQLLFNTKNFYGPSELVVQTNFEVDSVYRLEINSSFSEQYAGVGLSPLVLNKSLKQQLLRGSFDMQVQNAYIGDKLKYTYRPPVDSSAFWGRIAKTYRLDDFTRFTTMEEVMREYVSEVTVSRTGKRFKLKVLSENGFLDGDPLLMLDGIPVFSSERLFAVDPLKINTLQDINRVYHWGPTSSTGVFSFTSYKGDLAGLELDPRAVVLDYEGLQLNRDFYSPVYDNDAKRGSRLPDRRSTLYWSPNIKTDQQGKGAASFYTADQAGTYVGVLQGINANGEAGYKSFTFTVRK